MIGAAGVRRALARSAVAAAAAPRAAAGARWAALRVAAHPLSRGASSKADKMAFVCTSCGHDSPKWAGKCPACGEWNTMKEFRQASAPQPRNTSPSSFAASIGAPGGGRSGSGAAAAAGKGSWINTKARATATAARAAAAAGGEAAARSAVAAADEHEALGRLVPLHRIAIKDRERRSFGSRELDRLFGGGLVHGSVTLIAGSPGVGKSTLLLQIAALLSGGTTADGKPYDTVFNGAAAASASGAASGSSAPVAYISGEESALQIRSRAARLGINAPGLLVMNETRVEDILTQLASAAGDLEAVASAQADAAAAAEAAAAEADAAADGATASAAATGRVPTGTGGTGSPFSCIIVDSIQTMFTDAATAAAGTVTQVRESAVRLLQYAKATGTPLFLVGHVTKSGEIAGPRVLEHLVDAVVYCDGDDFSASGGNDRQGGSGGGSSGGGGLSTTPIRILRTVKNRFGSTSEVGIFEMTDAGFVESHAATAFLSSRHQASGAAAGGGGDEDDDDDEEDGDASRGSGSAIAVTVEGSRPLCVEIQALATRTPLPYPRHRATGVHLDRIHLLLAVLARHGTGIKPHHHDLFVNVVGGLSVHDTSADLAVAMSVVSSFTGKALARDMVFLGELGLGGEIRPVQRLQQRLSTAAQLGFRTAIVPWGSAVNGAPGSGGKESAGADAAAASSAATPSAASAVAARFGKWATIGPHGIVAIPVRSVRQAINIAFQHHFGHGSGNSSSGGAKEGRLAAGSGGAASFGSRGGRWAHGGSASALRGYDEEEGDGHQDAEADLRFARAGVPRDRLRRFSGGVPDPAGAGDDDDGHEADEPAAEDASDNRAAGRAGGGGGAGGSGGRRSGAAAALATGEHGGKFPGLPPLRTAAAVLASGAQRPATPASPPSSGPSEELVQLASAGAGAFAARMASASAAASAAASASSKPTKSSKKPAAAAATHLPAAATTASNNSGSDGGGKDPLADMDLQKWLAMSESSDPDLLQ